MSVDDINEIIEADRRRCNGEYTVADKMDLAEDMHAAGLIDKDGVLAIIDAALDKGNR